MKFVNVLLLSLLLCSMSSCVTLFGKKTEISLEGDMNTPVSIVAGKDNFTNLTLPCKIKIKKKTKNLLVYAPGHEMENIKLNRKFNASYLWNYFNFVGWFVDGFNGNIKKVSDKEVNIALNPSTTLDGGYMDVSDYFFNKGKEKKALYYSQQALSINPMSERASYRIQYIEAEKLRKQERSERRHKTWAAIGEALGDLGNALSAPNYNNSATTNTSAYISNTKNGRTNSVKEKNLEEIENLHNKAEETKKKAEFLQKRYPILDWRYSMLEDELIKMKTFWEKYYNDNRRKECQRKMKEIREEMLINGVKSRSKSPMEDWDGSIN